MKRRSLKVGMAVSNPPAIVGSKYLFRRPESREQTRQEGEKWLSPVDVVQSCFTTSSKLFWAHHGCTVKFLARASATFASSPSKRCAAAVVSGVFKVARLPTVSTCSAAIRFATPGLLRFRGNYRLLLISIGDGVDEGLAIAHRTAHHDCAS